MAETDAETPYVMEKHTKTMPQCIEGECRPRRQCHFQESHDF